MANEINRTVQYHRAVFKDGKFVGTEPIEDRVDEHSMHWNLEEDSFDIWAEGDVCIEEDYYTYGVFEFDLTVEEAKRLYDDLGQWLNRQDGSS